MDAAAREAELTRILGKIAATEPLTPEEARFLDAEAAIASLPEIGRGPTGGYADADEAPRDDAATLTRRDTSAADEWFPAHRGRRRP